MKIDKVDIKIIKHLRQNARSSIASIAKKIGLSPNATRNRYEKIKKIGLIKKTFQPTFLPQYVSGKSQTYKMQILLRTTINETKRLVQFIKELKIEYSQIECWETIGHFNILVWIISENPIDLHLVQDKIQNQPGVLQVKSCIITNMIDFYSKLNLQHLSERKYHG